MQSKSPQNDITIWKRLVQEHADAVTEYFEKARDLADAARDGVGDSAALKAACERARERCWKLREQMAS